MRARAALCLTALLCITLPAAQAQAQAQPEEDRAELRAFLESTIASSDSFSDRFAAEVWLVDMSTRLEPFVRDEAARLELLRQIHAAASSADLPPELVLSLIEVESAFDRFAVSRVGAQGLMQVMPFWRLEIGRDQDNLTDPETNIRYGTTILAHYMDRADGDLVDALGRYNGSRGKLWYPELVLTAWRRDWRNKSWGELPALRTSCSNYPLKACLYQ